MRLPKKSDKRFQKKVLQRLKKWLLQYKVSAHGLQFEEFDRYFPGWLREYHRETKSAEAGNLTKYSTINMDAQNKASGQAVNYNVLGGADNGDDMDIARKKLKEDQNRKGKSKLAGLLGSESTLTAEPAQKADGIDRSGWSAESVEWEGKLGEVAKAIGRTDKATREKIWDKFDRRGAGKLDCDKSLSRLIYSFFALYIKTRDRDGKPPKYNLLKPLLDSVCADIRSRINEVGGDPKNNFISKEDFVSNIADYLAQIALQRK